MQGIKLDSLPGWRVGSAEGSAHVAVTSLPPYNIARRWARTINISVVGIRHQVLEGFHDALSQAPR